MKYCPKNKNHKNPNEAVFCCECGSRLVEMADFKTCIKCGSSNPCEAMFCIECGTKLPDDKGFVELEVDSSEICERISVIGTNSYEINTSKCSMNVPVSKSVSVLLQCEGNSFLTTADLTKTNTLNVNWGTIELECEDSCEVRLMGVNMNSPLIKKIKSKDVIKVPYGSYKLIFDVDGESEEMTVDVYGRIAVRSHLRRKYELVINSDVEIDYLTIDNKHTLTVRSNKFSCKKEQGSYIICVHARNDKESGLYETNIDLNKDTTIDLKWCSVNINTNGQNTISIKQEGANVRMKITQYVSGPFSLLAVRGVKHELQLTKPHGGIHKQTIAPKDKKMDICLNWGDITIKFNKNNYNGSPCYFEFENKKIRIPDTKEVLIEDVLYGFHDIKYYIDSYLYIKSQKSFIIDNNESQITCYLSTERVTKEKFKWLRTTIYYILFAFDSYMLFLVSIREMLSFLCNYEFIHIFVHICYFVLSFLGFLYLYKNGLSDKKITKPIMYLSLFFLVVYLVSVLGSVGYQIYIKRSFNDLQFNMIPIDINPWNDLKSVVNPIVLSVYYGIIWGITHFVIKLKIKDYSIKETLIEL